MLVAFAHSSENGSLFGAILAGFLLLGEEHLDTGELFVVALKRPAYILRG
jgi:hypothetical protein